MKLLPKKFKHSDINEHISEAVYSLLDCAEKNVEAGYTLNIEHIEEIVASGLTYETFDMLVNNLNTELANQLEPSENSHYRGENLSLH